MERVDDAVTVGDSDGVMDKVEDPVGLCDGDGPLDELLALVEKVEELERLDVTDGEMERDLLLVTVGRNVRERLDSDPLSDDEMLLLAE